MSFIHIPREWNKAADCMAKWASEDIDGRRIDEWKQFPYELCQDLERILVEDESRAVEWGSHPCFFCNLWWFLGLRPFAVLYSAILKFNKVFTPIFSKKNLKARLQHNNSKAMNAHLSHYLLLWNLESNNFLKMVSYFDWVFDYL